MNVGELDGLYFIDTNVLVYSFDLAADRKRAEAQRILREALASRRGIIGSQVLQEFLNVAVRKFARPMGTTEAREFLHAVLTPLCQHYPSAGTYDRALLIREATGYAWYDALIVTAAIESGCSWLLSEDLEDGRRIDQVTIRNPFA